MSIEETINKLERINKGNYVHVINKALFYLKLDCYEDKNSLAKICEKACETKNWKSIKIVLSRYF